MPLVAKKKRIFQIAKELNISHLEIIQFLKNHGNDVDSHMAPVSPEAYDGILLEFSKDKLQIERHRKEQARKIVVSQINITPILFPAKVTSGSTNGINGGIKNVVYYDKVLSKQEVNRVYNKNK